MVAEIWASVISSFVDQLVALNDFDTSAVDDKIKSYGGSSF